MFVCFFVCSIFLFVCIACQIFWSHLFSIVVLIPVTMVFACMWGGGDGRKLQSTDDKLSYALKHIAKTKMFYRRP